MCSVRGDYGSFFLNYRRAPTQNSSAERCFRECTLQCSPSPGCGSKSSISAAAQAGRKRRLRSRLLRYYHVETPVPALITEVQQRWPCCISGGDRRDVMGATCPNGVVWTCCNGVRDFSRCTMGPATAGHPAPVALFYREVQRCKPFMMISVHLPRDAGVRVASLPQLRQVVRGDYGAVFYGTTTLKHRFPL